MKAVLRKATASVLALALVALAPGLAPYQAVAMEIRVRTQAPVKKGPGVAVVPTLGNPLGTGLKLTNGSFQPTPLIQNGVQLQTGDNTALTGAQNGAALPQITAKTGAVVTANTGAAVNAAQKAKADVKGGLGVVEAVKAELDTPTGDFTQLLGDDVLAPSSKEQKGGESDRQWAETSFDKLRGRKGGSDAVSVKAGPQKLHASGLTKSSRQAEKKNPWYKRGIMATVAVMFISGTSQAQSAGSGDAAQAQAAAQANQPEGSMAALSDFGYGVGNVLAFIFPIPQVYKAIKTGDRKTTPLWQSMVLFSAQMALGLVSAAATGKWFWGVQNLFGGLVIPIGLVAMRFMKSSPDYQAPQWRDRVPEGTKLASKAGAKAAAATFGERLRTDRALWRTALVAGITMAVSLGLFAVASSFMPGLLAAAFGQAAIGTILLYIQAITGAAYFLLFMPDIIQVMQGKAPKGFTPGFSLQFFLASFAFILWTVPVAMAAAPGSTEKTQFWIYAGLNAAYAVVSFLSYRYAKRELKREQAEAAERQTSAEQKDEPPPGQVQPPGGSDTAQAGTKTEESLRDEAEADSRQEKPVSEVTDDQIVSSEPAIEAVSTLPKDLQLTSAQLLELKTEAQARARALAQDARLVKVTINLNDPRAHWTFVFASDKKKRVYTVWQKRIGTGPLNKKDKLPTLWDSRLAELRPAAEAAALVPGAARLEIVPAWKGPASFALIDGAGRASNVAGTAEARPAREADLSAAKLLELKERAQARARKQAPDARLIKAAINLKDGRSHWSFVFASDKKKRIYTVWEKRMGVGPLNKKDRHPTLWNSRLLRLRPLAEAEKELNGVVPVRVEIQPSWKGDADYIFYDAKGAAHRMKGVGSANDTPQPPPASEKKDPVDDQTQTPPADDKTQTPEPPKNEPPAETKPDDSASGRVVPDAKNFKPIREDFFGFRSAHGLVYDKELRRLPFNATADQVIEHMSRQFGIERAKVVALAAQHKLLPSSPASDWLAVYDRLQKANREHFAQLDQKKYKGWGSFRQLANKTYAPGWKGALHRTLELHKHFMGFFVRLPYHLFDMFLFGYFRKNITFQFFRANQNFIEVGHPGASEKWLTQALRQHAYRGPGVLSSLKGSRSFRAADYWLIQPLFAPLKTFIIRRLTLAVLSAIAMGLLGAAAPMLPLSFSLLSIPVLGPAIMGLASGAPAVVAAVPLVGELLAPVVGTAMQAFVNDLVLGPLLNTLILSTLLTFPREVRAKLFALKQATPDRPAALAELLLTVLKTAASWSFWGSNLKSMFGLMTVGAEIEGIMTYAEGIDSAVTPAWKQVTGHNFTAFHAIGAAVERPEGASPIPFGGAITWGNVLLYKFQDVLGFDIADNVMRGALVAKTAAFGESAADAALAKLPAAGIVQAASERPDAVKYAFDRELYKKSPAEVTARVKELMSKTGHLNLEREAVKKHMAELKAELAGLDGRIAELEKQSRPITEAERAEYARLLEELKGKRQEDYVESKLAQKYDLANPKPEDLERLRELKKLQDYYDAILLPPSDTPGFGDELELKKSQLGALSSHLTAIAEGKSMARSAPADPETVAAIQALVTEIEALRAEARGEMATRDATKNLLAVANKARNHVLRDRRDGSEMQEFQKNMAKLATVMDLALSLNEIAAAQQALREMLDMLDKKIAKVHQSQQGNQDAAGAAQAHQQMVQQWTNELNQTIADDAETKQRVVDNEKRAGMAALRFQNFQTDMKALIETIDAQDKGQSADALAEYQRRINLLPTIQQWRADGNPNDPDALSLKGMQEDLKEVQDNIKEAEDGLARIRDIPVEAGGALIAVVPGPVMPGQGQFPSWAEVSQMLVQRKAHWEAKRADYQKSLGSINRMMDPSNTAMKVDDFGDPVPESLPRWKAVEQANLTQAKGRIDTFTAQMDQYAAQINQAAGSNIPMLSGLGLEQLRDALENYGDALKAVNLPDSETMEGHEASLNLIATAKLLTYTARETVRWAYADAVITGVDEAMADELPKAKNGIQGIVALTDDILSDLAVDQQIAAAGGGGSQAIIDRKLALIEQKILPRLRAAETMLRDTMIPFQQESIDQAGQNGKLFELFDAKKELKTEIDKLYGKTLPWAIASFGAEEGNVAEAKAEITAWAKDLQENLDGYDDATGHHKGVRQFLLELAQRRDPSFTGTEVLYGEEQPYSLPRKIAKYDQEKTERAAQINQQAAEMNEIMAKIEEVSRGRFNFSQFRFPTGLGTDQASVDRVQKLVDEKLITLLGDELGRVSDLAQAEATGDLSIGGGGDGTVPTGTQPPITVSEADLIGMLCKDISVRLVPASHQNPSGAAAAYAVARYLYSNAVSKGAADALANQVPKAEAFLNRAAGSIQNAIDKTALDIAYVESGQTSETPEQVYARKVAVFADLQAMLQEGIAFFDLKQSWNQDGFETLDDIAGYYESIYDIHDGGLAANDGEITVYTKMRDALKKTYDELEADRIKVGRWMAQLNPKEKSALANVSESIAEIQVKTKDVLEANIKYHDLKDQLTRSDEILKAGLGRIDDKQNELKELLKDPDTRGGLPPDLVNRIEALRLHRGLWAMGQGSDAKAAQALVVKKSEFAFFIDHILGLAKAKSSTQDLGMLKADLLKNPEGLAALIPGSQVLDFGDTADGFYLVYQSKFAVPHGLETGSWVTLGNIGNVWGNNVSVTGYQFASPPNENNAPYGDKGVALNVESLQGRNWVNYFTVDFHRFALDIPANTSARAQADASRLMVFEDFAVMALDDRLYIGLAGFGDFAMKGTKDEPYYYGGNLKTEFKMTEVLKLNAEQRLLFANDPRSFLQQVNLDFTGYDPDLDRTWNIEAHGEKKWYSRSQLGPQLDVARLMNSQDTFTVEVFAAQTLGTDDINQKTVGATIVKGFSIKNDQGKTIAQIDNRATGELGEKMNTLSDRISLTLPDQGIVVSAEGKLLGSASALYGEVQKKTGANTSIALGYGSRYVGENNRLQITMNTSFTLGELWQAVSDNASGDLKGGETLQAFNKELDDFFGQDEPSKTVQELQKVFKTDVGRQLISQDIGALTRDVKELRRAGAFMDNTRVRGMVGFVSNNISMDVADRAVGGGFVVGTHSEMTLTKSQKALIEAKSESLYREGVRLQARLLDLTKQWQGAVVEMAQAQWEMKVAEFEVQNAPNDALRSEAKVRAAEARDRLHQALLKYNSLTGREPTAPPPFAELNASDLQSLIAEVRKTVAAPDRMEQVLHGLDREALKEQLGEDPFNVLDWIPWVDRLTVGFGVQFQDMMANQVLGAGMSIRLPVYDPASKHRDHAFQLESRATVKEIEQVYADARLVASQEREKAKLWKAGADAVRPGLDPAAAKLGDAIRAYRNGLITSAKLREAFNAWRWYMSQTLEADSQALLADAWASIDEGFVKPQQDNSAPGSLTDFDRAFRQAVGSSAKLEELLLRQQSASAMTKANDARIQKFFVDLHIGMNLTASGVGWLPSIGMTGIPITPVLGFDYKPEELRALQKDEGLAHEAYYENLRIKAEADIALQIALNIAGADTARRMIALLENKLIPERSRQGDQRGLDEAKLRLQQARMAEQQAVSTLNYLMGRPQGSPLAISVDPQSAFDALRQILAERDPVGTHQNVLDARVRAAKDVETIRDKDLKVRQMTVEPVSLVVSSLGRLIETLGGGGANPDLVAAARLQTLTEERAADTFPDLVKVQAAKAQAELSIAISKLKAVEGKTDIESQLTAQALRGRVFALSAALEALGGADDGSGRTHQDVPETFAELSSRLALASGKLSADVPQTPLEFAEPEILNTRSSGYARYFYAHTTLDKDVKIDKGFVETWMEVRLKDMGTPPEVLLALSKLRYEKADRIYRTTVAAGEAKAKVLAAQFEANVRLLRWAEAKGHGKLKDDLLGRMALQRDEMAALLQLDPKNDPQELLEKLIALVPYESSGAQELDAQAGRFIDEIQGMHIDEIRRTLFDGGLPESFGSEDGIINQIKANTIAERMSYKGFTPVGAFGVFRDQMVGGVFLEAPDPRAIERGLTNVLSDVLRKELESTGRMKELSLKLHLLMSRVEDGAHELEARREAIQTAEGELRAKTALGDADEMLAAQDRLAQAWLGFAQSMAEVKNDFIALVTELEALGQGRSLQTASYFRADGADMSMLKRDSRAELLRFLTERMLDAEFQDGLEPALDGLSPALPPELRDKLRQRSAIYRQAKLDHDALQHAGFGEAERQELLMRNDLEGKRLALEAVWSDVLRAVGRLDPKVNPAWEKLLAFVRADLELQTAKQGERIAQYDEVIDAMGQSWRDAAHVPMPVKGAVDRLALLHEDMAEKRRTLMTGYLSELEVDPTRLVMKDLDLDSYLKAQQAFDDELIKTLQSSELKEDASLARGLNGLYDVRKTLERQQAAVKSGRGMAALDALIMLEQARLHAARWRQASPNELDAVARALQTLKETRDRWAAGASSLKPLFAVTQPGEGGRRTWNVSRWLTLDEARSKELTVKDGRVFLKNGEELIGGVDVKQSAVTDARGAKIGNDELLRAGRNPENADLLVAGVDRAYSIEDVFGQGGLHSQGRVFFFEAPSAKDKPGRAHLALHPMQALGRDPTTVEMLIYAGNKPLSRGAFPTLESLQFSPEGEDFHRLLLTDKGALELAERARSAREITLRQGWLEVKLNGYGFARDADGGVAQLYVTEDDFRAQLKAFKNAAADLAKLKAELGEARDEAGRLQLEAEASREGQLAANVLYQAAVLKVRDRLFSELSEEMSTEDPKFKAELEKRVSKDKKYKEAQESYAPVAKKAGQVQDKHREAKARVDNLEKDVKEGELILARSGTWSLYQSKDVTLWTDDQGATARVTASPLYGALALDDRVGRGAGLTPVSGELYGAVIDEQGRLLKWYGSDEAIENAAKSWQLKSVNVGGDQTAASPDGKTVKPVYRLSHYEENGRPVLLNARYLAERLDNAGTSKTMAKHWGLMPWRWGSLVLEVPRSIVGVPVEIITGRDPRQHHYLGRVAMYKTEGGDTERHGFFRSVVGAIDVLNLLPDPVGRYFDPSQFPSTVQIDSRIEPGQDIFSKKARSGDKNIHFGQKYIERTMKQAAQDMQASRERTLSRFHGGAEELLIETRRGRNGSYTESTRRALHGEAAVDESLADPLIGLDPNTKADNTVVIGAKPGHIEVDNIERRVTIRPGEKRYAKTADLLEKWRGELAERTKTAEGASAGLETALADAGKEFDGSKTRRDAVSAEERALWDKYHKLGWRIGAQEALERELARLKDQATALRQRLAWWGKYYDRLKNPRVEPTDPTNPTDPTDPTNPTDPTTPPPWSQAWVWALVAFFIAALLSALARLRRRRPLAPAQP